MKIALILTDKFDDYELLKLKLFELDVTHIVAGTSKTYKLIEQYKQNYSNVIIELAEGEKAYRAYNAISKTENVVVFTNGTGHINKTRTNLAIKNAIKNNKHLYIYPYKESAFSIEKIDQYIKIDFIKNVKIAFGTDGIYLNQEETKKLIEKLQSTLKNN